MDGVERAADALGPRSGFEGADAQPRVWDVAALVRAAADALGVRFGAVAVRGEVGNWGRAPSGHCYFSLKDGAGTALLRCAMFRRAAALLDFAPQDGDAVELRGRLAVYEPRGELQFVVESMRRAGAGALWERYLRLKAQLEAQGLFDPARKRPVSAHPRALGIVTSPAAAALQDVLTALARRAPHVRVIVYPAPVQGVEAPAALAQALALANRRREVDTLLLVRGGGSLEDLWAFNEAQVVRAVASSALPVIVGVGHETDVSLADFAADVRAPTPTAAAELAAAPREQSLALLRERAERGLRALRTRLDGRAQTLDRLALRLAGPARAVAPHRERLMRVQGRLSAGVMQRLHAQRPLHEALAGRLHAAGIHARGSRRQGLAALAARLLADVQHERGQHRQRLDLLAARLAALDPSRVLARGYAWLGDEAGRALVSVAEVRPGQALRVQMSDGRVHAQATAVEPQTP